MPDSKEFDNLMKEIKATADELRGNIGEYRSIKAKVEELIAEHSKHKEALASIETKLNRPVTVGAGTPSEPSPEMKAFVEYARKAVKSLEVSSDALGGYLVPPEFVAKVLQRQFDLSPIRKLAFVQKTSRGAVQVPRETGDIGASWVGETESSGDTQSTYGIALEENKVHKLVARIDVSNDLLDDAAVDVEALLSTKAAKKFAVAEGAAFVNGTGNKQPEGIMVNADVGHVASGDASKITIDGMLDVWGELKSYYEKNATYIMNKKTMVAVRKLRDANGVYYWQGPLTAGMPPTFNGIPIVLCVDMPDIESGAFPVAIGDFYEAYMIVDGKDMTVVRDEITQADNDLVRFRFKQRTGGQVVQAEAVKKLEIATS